MSTVPPLPPPLRPALPAAAYTDPARLPAERARLFGPAWAPVGHAAELPGPGSLRAHRHAGWPLILLRDEAGTFRCFGDVCPHRGGYVLDPDEALEGQARLRCRVHGWRFDLRGRLTASPGFCAEADAARALSPGLEGCGLPARPAAEAHGLLWVWAAEGPAPALADWLGPLGPALEARGLAALRPRRRARHRLACDWKVYVENYLEGYHIPHAHPALAAELHLPGYRVRPLGPGWLHEAPTRPGAKSEGFWAWIWPAAALNAYDGGASLERIQPAGPGLTEIDYLYLAPEGQPEADFEATLALSARTTAEDQALCERVMQNLQSGLAQQVGLSPRHEGAVADFQARVAAGMGAPGPT